MTKIMFEIDDMNKAENILVYGTTGSGKSTFHHTFIKGVTTSNKTNNVKLLLVDSKKIEFNRYENSTFLLSPIIHNREELLSKINELINECQRGKETIRNSGFDPQKSENCTQFPYILLIIDEFVEITSKIVNNYLLELLKEGYRYKIHVILSTQSIGEGVAEIDFFKAFKTIICQRNHEEKETRLLMEKKFFRNKIWMGYRYEI